MLAFLDILDHLGGLQQLGWLIKQLHFPYYDYRYDNDN
jgi:hypothetical protein